ncbi:hypothetical protein SAMN05428967_3196 [Phyllobacterium sp. YR620]|uniref:DUF6456 domain-containing protein n=1 Tax=Phyllobacterium sp. YR620 TaxID=1881066 RepID=UPI000882FEAC|nr:DUF6456 domain-containing protein [Phyllobacterium sp. YR620]SDP72128.1 hypothetical protein SAMN05428967_3196 [Phyllobacterium sp. YR620]
MRAANDKTRELRLLRFLAKGPGFLVDQAGSGRVMLESREHGAISVEHAAVKSALSNGSATLRGTELSLSEAGKAHLRRVALSDDPFAGQHREVTTVVLADRHGTSQVRSNQSESPLATLRKRKDAGGTPFINDEAFKAGERLRADYTIGNLMPSIGANWDVTGSASRSNGVLDITDAALAARQRVERALEAVGPELSGVLVDVCCFLKGLELVERERQWPVRSAKLILRTALAALDRHYHPAMPSPRSQRIIHWGTEDYRPAL